MATTTKKTADAEVAEAVETAPAPTPVTEKIVTIKIPRSMDKNEEDKVVWVNERRYLIKKGIPVDVPEPVALILEQEERMLQYIYDYEQKVQR